MGTQVAITIDYQKKPQYVVSTVLSDDFSVETDELVMFFGNAHGGGKLFEVTGIRSCLERIREGGTLTPSAGNTSFGKVPVPGLKFTVSTGFDVAPASALTGTVTVTIGTADVVGVGTAFTTELKVGQSVIIEGETHTILTIADDENLVLATNHVAGAAAVAMTLANVPAETDIGIWYGEDFQSVTNSSITPRVLRALERYMEDVQKAA